MWQAFMWLLSACRWQGRNNFVVYLTALKLATPRHAGCQMAPRCSKACVLVESARMANALCFAEANDTLSSDFAEVIAWHFAGIILCAACIAFILPFCLGASWDSNFPPRSKPAKHIFVHEFGEQGSPISTKICVNGFDTARHRLMLCQHAAMA